MDLDVALTPRQARAVDVAVVVDALRATSTAAQALAAGYRRILCASGRCPRVLLGSLLNLDAVADWLRRAAAGGATPEVQIICAGIEGRFALEDVYVAGRLSALLDATRSDAALVAEGLARSFRTPLEALESGGGAAMLRAAGMERDVALCARESVLDTVPVVTGVRRGVAIVADGARRPVLGVTVEGRNPSMAVAR